MHSSTQSSRKTARGLQPTNRTRHRRDGSLPHRHYRPPISKRRSSCENRTKELTLTPDAVSTYLDAALNVFVLLTIFSILIDLSPDHLPIRKRTITGMQTLQRWSGSYSAQQLILRICRATLALYLRALGNRYSVR